LILHWDAIGYTILPIAFQDAMPRSSIRGIFFCTIEVTSTIQTGDWVQTTMGMESGHNSGVKSEQGGRGATITTPIATTGELFTDGSMIELISGDNGGNPHLMLWNGTNESTGSFIEYGGLKYEAAQFPRSVLRELALPTKCCPHGTTHELLARICELVEKFVGLPSRSASLVGRFALCSWLVESVQIAPALVLVGPDTLRGNQLVALLHCLCRHALRVTGLTPGGFRSLPTGAGFTFLVSQPTISDTLVRMLNDASHRDQKIPYGGGLLDLFGAQVIHTKLIPFGESWPLRSIQIPMIPGGAQLPALGPEVQRSIKIDFQAKLLGFRRANLSAALNLQFDSSKFIFPLRELAHSIAAATPDDVGLQGEVFELLREEDEAIRDGKWIELNAVALESLIVACHESPGGVIYVGEIAEIAREILHQRGGDTSIDPGALGKCLKLLGFKTSPRDSKGIKIRLTHDLCRRARQLAQDFGVAHEEDPAPMEPEDKQA
jgi:hypothetical protein